jgi:hypothetical protein
MDSGIQRSRSTEAPLSIDLPSRAISLDQILLGPSPRPFLLGSEEVLGLGGASICPAAWPRVGPPRRPTSASIPRGPRPALPAPGPADPTARIPALLVTAIGAAAEGGPVRRPSASWWQPEGAHCLLLAPVLRCGTACGLPGVRECMPMAATGRSNRYTKATKPANRP